MPRRQSGRGDGGRRASRRSLGLGSAQGLRRDEESEARQAAGPAGWTHGLGTAPPAAPPAWGNFTPSRVSVPARSPAPWAPVALAPAIANSLPLLSFRLLSPPPPRAMCLQPPCASAGRARKVWACGARTRGWTGKHRGPRRDGLARGILLPEPPPPPAPVISLINPLLEQPSCPFLCTTYPLPAVRCSLF